MTLPPHEFVGNSLTGVPDGANWDSTNWDQYRCLLCGRVIGGGLKGLKLHAKDKHRLRAARRTG